MNTIPAFSNGYFIVTFLQIRHLALFPAFHQPNYRTQEKARIFLTK